MRRVEFVEIQDADKNDLIEFGVVLSAFDLRDIGFGSIIGKSFPQPLHMFHLHFDDERHAAFVFGANVKQGIFQRFETRRLIRVQQFDLLNFFVLSQIKDSVQEGDQDFFMLLIAENLFKCDIIAWIHKFHDIALHDVPTSLLRGTKALNSDNL